MNIITVTSSNLNQEDICCANSNSKDNPAAAKKDWLSKRFEEGLVFKKSDIRGKCFIEYIPAENAWYPIKADGYMFIDCFWVSGQMKGHGYSTMLLDECIKDSKEKGRKGLVILSSNKKKPFLSDPKYLRHKDFQLADTAEPYYELMYLPFDKDEVKPCFNENVKKPHINEKGFVLYYSSQCPYAEKYAPLLKGISDNKGIPFKLVHINSKEQAQAAPAPFTTYSLFYDGNFVTNEILSEKKFLELIS